MTYPPQSGQPGAYGHTPDPYAQQPDVWGAPQQPTHPASGPIPTPQPGQPAPFSYPGTYTGGFLTPQGSSGQQPQPPTPKKKTGLIVGLAIAATAVVAGVVTLFFVLDSDGSGNGDADDLADLADKAVTAFNERDRILAAEISCTGRSGGVSTTDVPENVRLERRGEISVDGHTATIPMTVSADGQTADIAFSATKTEGRWCLSGRADTTNT